MKSFLRQTLLLHRWNPTPIHAGIFTGLIFVKVFEGQLRLLWGDMCISHVMPRSQHFIDFCPIWQLLRYFFTLFYDIPSTLNSGTLIQMTNEQLSTQSCIYSAHSTEMGLINHHSLQQKFLNLFWRVAQIYGYKQKYLKRNLSTWPFSKQLINSAI